MSDLFSSSGIALSALAGLQGLFASPRSRQEWNDRFTHWQRPASVTETGTIERAQSNVTAAISSNTWLQQEHVRILPQGSYYNNTNVRTEADIDLRALHPLVRIEYAANVLQDCAWAALGYSHYGLTFDQVFNRIRAELTADLTRRFGQQNVVAGQKALRIKGITGSRAEVDVVPAIRFHQVLWQANVSRYLTVEGVAILARDGRWTLNFPEQHHVNGIDKRTRTSHRFKRIVRIFKRLRSDLEERGLLTVTVPSFLVECLVYLVEDEYFLIESDDQYGRVRRIAHRLQALLANSQAVAQMTEINGIKLLFHPDQGWTYLDALTFANTVVAQLGNL
ncbi:hypothetical protein [Burkholderia pseudomallei]|uniref:hypothetical protein n=1 Tax=Burkholderia pseudomallei TaxID=28450 RepID=UPI00135DC989|nr:hypothetical protein [Burkholderia pseudomallei]MWA35488.1 hypothetical protein [Burkholderia pseudomallei]